MLEIRNKGDLLKALRKDKLKISEENITIFPVRMSCEYIRIDKLIKLIYDTYEVYPCVFYEEDNKSCKLFFEFSQPLNPREFNLFSSGFYNVLHQCIKPTTLEEVHDLPKGKIFIVNKENIINEFVLKKIQTYGNTSAEVKKEEMIKIKYTDTYNKVKPNFGIESKLLKENEARDITYKELSKVIARGGTFISAEYEDPKGDYNKENIKCIPMLALDIDYNPQKEAEGKQRITMQEFTQLLSNELGITPVISYPTFSDIDNTSFRVIYKFETALSGNKFEEVYKCIINKYPQYLDPATKNSNRLWAGTKHKVIYNDLSRPITEEVLKDLERYKPVIEPKIKEYKPRIQHTPPTTNTIYDNFYIKEEYKKTISDMLIQHIQLDEYIKNKFGGAFTQKGDKLFGACPIHGGSCPTSLVVYLDTNSAYCWSEQQYHGIIDVASRVYNTNDFSYIAFMLCEEYGIEIPMNAIAEKRTKKNKRGSY